MVSGSNSVGWAETWF